MEHRTRKCTVQGIDGICTFVMWTERMTPVDDRKRFCRMQPMALVEKPNGQITEAQPVTIQFIDRTAYKANSDDVS